MQRPLTRLFTLLVFAFATLCMASATSAQSKPHLATGFGQFAANQADFTGFGQATHLGKYTEVGNVQLAPSGTEGVLAVNGWAHYTASNGDELFAIITGTLDLTTGVILATATYVGGTGRFEDASGSSDLAGQMLGGGALSISAVGSIDY